MKSITRRIRISNFDFKSFSNNSALESYWNHLFFSKTLQNHVQLINQSTFFFDFCDVFDIFIAFEIRFFRFFSKYRFFQFKSVMFWFKDQTIQWCHEFFTKFRALSKIVSISKNKIARIHVLNSQWFRLKMIQETIAFQLFVSF